MPKTDFAVTLPIFEPEVFDNSMMETHSRCPRKYFYRYGLRRAPRGENFPIQFGLAYHDYRERIQPHFIEGVGVPLEVHEALRNEIVGAYEDPPLGHRKDYLTASRLEQTLDLAFARINHEVNQGLKVIQSEQSFQLELDGVEELFGGRMDQVIFWNGAVWMRDFKTTSRMGSSYSKKFNPSNQMTGYVWAAGKLGGKLPKGVLIEVVYNTKRSGPEFHQFLTERTPGQIEQWMETAKSEIAEIRRNHQRTEKMGYLAWPQRTGACEDFGGCFYKDACKGDSAFGIEFFLKNQTDYSEWDFNDPNKESASETPST